MKKMLIFLYIVFYTVYLNGQRIDDNKKSLAPIVHSLSSVNSQQDVLNDSLRKLLTTAMNDSARFETLGKLAFSYAWSNPDSSMIYAQEQLLLAKSIKSVRFEGRALWSNGVVASTMGNYAQAIDFFFTELNNSRKNKRQNGIVPE